MEVRDIKETLTPHHIMRGYWLAYKLAYGQQPNVRYMGNQWYQINGELVHRTDILLETSRLNDLARQRRRHNAADKGVISRLIAKLRGM